MISKPDISAFILAGGFSSRMGTNKAFLEINGIPLIKRLILLLENIFPKIIISSNEPELFYFTGKHIIKDVFPRKGPLAGIHSCLFSSETEINFIIPVDMPFISFELIDLLIKQRTESDIFLPAEKGKVQQLCGFYSRSLLPEIELTLIEGSDPNSKTKGSVYNLLNKVSCDFVEVSGEQFYHSNLFMNLNTPEDYHIAKSLIEKN